MGITISVTIPNPLEQELSKKAKESGMSRSRFICNILLKWDEKMKQPVRPHRDPKEIHIGMDLNAVPNDCPNRDSDGFCNVFDLICNAPQSQANTCVGYPKDENRGK